MAEEAEIHRVASHFKIQPADPPRAAGRARPFPARPGAAQIQVPTTTRPGAAIFDLDGTVVDNMSLHAEAFAVRSPFATARRR
ncbi:MAG: hypothetical protein R2708_05135 [Vicinamibacterales bacterium]